MSGFRRIVIGLCLVAIGLAALSFFTALRSNASGEAASHAAIVSDAFQSARLSVMEEESLERKYRLEPSAEVRHKHAAAAGLVGALTEIDRIGEPDDRELASGVLSSHAAYVRMAESLFDAVDAGQTAVAHEIDENEVDPTFGRIEAEVGGAAEEHRLEALAELSALRRTEHLVLWVIPAGIVLLAIFAGALVRTHRLLHEHAAESEHDALHDSLTGLPNRTLFKDRLEHAIHTAGRDAPPFSVLMMDLDRFKEVNDTLGHGAGDELLSGVGSRLESVLRPGDTVARLGGDEFGVLLAGADSEAAGSLAERLHEALQEPFALMGLSIAVRGSFGIVTYPVHADTADVLLQRADVAMYVAKRGDVGTAVYDPSADLSDAAHLQLASDLRRAVVSDEFELHYQPRLTTDSLHLDGVEALARWRHPTRGLLPPSEFITLAEHTGLMKQLTRCVLRQAARQQRSWRQQGLDVKTAVNLSVANLLDSDFPEIVSETLEAEGLPADWLELEVTESAAMVDPERSAQALERLAATGIDLAIDDFGTGQSSLAYLRRLPVGSLKIDRSFVKHLAVDERDAEIVCSTIKLGQALGLRVVAEGVEDPKALSILQEHGCDLVQGFLFGKPALPGVMFEELRRFQSSRAGRVRSPGDPAHPQREVLRSPVPRAARSHLA